MPTTEFSPDVAGLLGRLRDRLSARADVVGVYVYGSLVTGDYSPAYWRQISRKRRLWLYDSWVDHSLVVLPRAEAVLTAGDFITKSQAISRLAGFGVPDALAREIRRRRDGDPIALSRPGRLVRAVRARRIMQNGVARLSRIARLRA